MTWTTQPDDEDTLLSILHAHGQQFLSTFGIPTTSKHRTNDSDDSKSEEEWAGIGSPANGDTFQAAFDDGHDGEIDQEDDGFTASSLHTPDVTIFAESARKRPEADFSAKELRKSFMSSKVSNVTLFPMRSISKDEIPDGESDDERTNVQNDALLRRLVHTQLLSGSLNPELDLSHAERGRALAGRVLELTGKAKLGKGEGVFRQEQRNKAAKRVRDGLVRKEREQAQKSLDEAKNLGNYHPSLKRLYDTNSSSVPKKKRTRGLGMGVGKFVGGTLKVSREEIVSAMGTGKQDYARRRKRQRPH